MKDTVRVSASLSCVDLLNLHHEIKRITRSRVSFIHYDVVDGIFNDCFGLGDLELKAIRSHTHLDIEVHLAVENPYPYLKPFIAAGANIIAVHYESMSDPRAVLAEIIRLGAKPVLAYRAETRPQPDLIALARDVEWILKLTVNPGFSGQTLKREALNHIRDMRDMLDRAHVSTLIQADGNVNPETVADIVRAGAGIVTGGTSGLLIPGTDIDDNLERLLQAIG